jgi:hypothetical protein
MATNASGRNKKIFLSHNGTGSSTQYSPILYNDTGADLIIRKLRFTGVFDGVATTTNNSYANGVSLAFVMVLAGGTRGTISSSPTKPTTLYTPVSTDYLIYGTQFPLSCTTTDSTTFVTPTDILLDTPIHTSVTSLNFPAGATIHFCEGFFSGSTVSAMNYCGIIEYEFYNNA